jgi:hypothetical protein
MATWPHINDLEVGVIYTEYDSYPSDHLDGIVTSSVEHLFLDVALSYNGNIGKAEVWGRTILAIEWKDEKTGHAVSAITGYNVNRTTDSNGLVRVCLSDCSEAAAFKNMTQAMAWLVQQTSARRK